jgi:hypothetical protein
VTKDQVKAYVQAVLAVGEVIKTLGSVPSGELYAQLMGSLSIDTYTRIISLLKASGKVKESNYLLTWVK